MCHEARGHTSAAEGEGVVATHMCGHLLSYKAHRANIRNQPDGIVSEALYKTQAATVRLFGALEPCAQHSTHRKKRM